MDCSTVKAAARGLLPPLTAKEQQKLAAALVRDAMAMFRGKAGATLAITDASGACITARSKPLEVIAFRMRQYNACPALFRFFLSRHEGELFDKLRAYYEQTFPECMEV
ncbi:MAG: hypothetical protein PUH11_01955 [Bacilli bacterium]|nr:hypothetical protein [Bacilli bacterium]